MKLTTRRIVFAALILALVLMPLQAALAKGIPAKIVITGSGIDGEVTITDVASLEIFTFRFVGQGILSPDLNLGDGYRLERYMVMESHWDTYTYYPDPDGGAGYINYNGNKYPTLYAANRGQWYRALPETDALMQQIIAEHAVQPAAPPPSMSASPALIGALVMLGSLLLVISVAVTTRHRRAAPAL